VEERDHPPVPAKNPSDEELGPPVRAEPVEESAVTVGELVDGAQKILGDLGTSARRLIDRGRYRKVRISRKGKPLLPDIPLAAVAAIEAASMVGGGVARVLALNVGAKLLFDVDLINEADKFLLRGKEALLDGDLDRAAEALEKAIRIDDLHPEAHLQLGVLERLRGDPDRARRYLERARQLDELGEVGKRAEAILKALEGGG
jgi:tetratricopeptide (TPR) repeat protein